MNFAASFLQLMVAALVHLSAVKTAPVSKEGGKSKNEVVPFMEVYNKSMCRTREVLVDIYQEYPDEIEHTYIPSCVVLSRCAGCCTDEALECVPTETRNVTLETKERSQIDKRKVSELFCHYNPLGRGGRVCVFSGGPSCCHFHTTAHFPRPETRSGQLDTRRAANAKASMLLRRSLCAGCYHMSLLAGEVFQQALLDSPVTCFYSSLSFYIYIYIYKKETGRSYWRRMVVCGALGPPIAVYNVITSQLLKTD
uniref:Platelet-derived growth factor (PDGF) family profile domain-containing protein n=1 Tax=Denticeps clupeoides TaxID=299321 RepID=A0AAY4AJE8_9TELE